MTAPDETDAARLKTVLTRFAAEILSADSPREGVAVEVTRQGGFGNLAVAGDRLHLLLDEPAHFGGSGAAMDPAQVLLSAIGASLSVTLTAHAALRDVVIDGVRLSLSAGIDGRSFFQPGGPGEPGLLDCAIDLFVQSPAPERTIRALLADVLLATPVLQSLRSMPEVRLHLAR